MGGQGALTPLPGPSKGSTALGIMIDNNHYLAERKASDSALEDFTYWTPRLVTYLRLPDGLKVAASVLEQWKEQYRDQDDVSHANFLHMIIFGRVDREPIEFGPDVDDVFKKWKTAKLVCLPAMRIKSGPYYVHKGVVYALSKVYPDRQLAFVQATGLSAETCSQRVRSLIQRRLEMRIEVMESLCLRDRIIWIHLLQFREIIDSKIRTIRPLWEMRIAVNDNFHIRGTYITFGNPEYLEAYPALQEENADVVSLLKDAGAIIVGLICDDGTSNTEPTGSARIPALQTGVFGFRPSTDAISSNGLVKAWPEMDTPGLLGRDREIFPDVFRDLNPSSAEQESRGHLHGDPLEILCQTDFVPQDNPEQIGAMENFLDSISKATGRIYRSISIHEDWRKTAPVEEEDLHQYLYNLMHHGWYYAAYHSFDKFRRDYEELHGHAPFVMEVVRWYCYGRLNSLHFSYRDNEPNLCLRSWFLERFVSSSQMIMAIHIDSIKLRYRDEYPGNNNPEVPELRPTYLAAMLRAPELANSNFSNTIQISHHRKG
ncbi:Amidase [Penicillium occitanis (nom. inval.)]|nr:Amidase [Penicillium occitanis (nom. inval.)]PCH03191.1 hypothetical protein PENOC_039860 [Penicillium occitanis (nom. inval.)]